MSATQDTAGELRRLRQKAADEIQENKGSASRYIVEQLTLASFFVDHGEALLDERDRLRTALTSAVACIRELFDRSRDDVMWKRGGHVRALLDVANRTLGGGARKEESHGK